MPATTIVDAETPDEQLAELREKISSAIRKHVGAAEYVRAQRRRRLPNRTPPLPQQVRCDVDEGETIDAIAEEASVKIMEIILADAAGEKWGGEVHVCGAELRNGFGPKILARIPVEIDGESPEIMTKARAETDTMAAQSRTIDGLGSALVKIANAKASDAEAMSKMIAAVADMHRADAKWNYKIEKERQETEREEIKERANTTRAKARWDVFETLIEEYKDVATIWSQWFTTVRKPGEGISPGKPPTETELASVFTDGRFEQPVTLDDGNSYNVRGVVAEMIAEPDRRRRIMVAKRLTAVLNGLPPAVQTDLRATMIRVLGPERALEIAVWLSLPIVG